MKSLMNIFFILLILSAVSLNAQQRIDSLTFLPAPPLDIKTMKLGFDPGKMNQKLLYRSSWSYLGGFAGNFVLGDPINRFQAGSIMDIKTYESRNWTEYNILADRLYFINYQTQKNAIYIYRD
ncbi:hypothetical protein AB2B38_007835 [Balneola sp. MJW-20]|uniref:hypothetical protein n=1 Tax=Gracilimonas aurantiaca TaxID=3234185 RepID=UPI00390A4D45